MIFGLLIIRFDDDEIGSVVCERGIGMTTCWLGSVVVEIGIPIGCWK